MTLKDAEELIQQFDDDGSGTIDLMEFTALVQEKQKTAAMKQGEQARLLHAGALKHDRDLMAKATTKQMSVYSEQRKRLASELQQTKEARFKEMRDDFDREKHQLDMQISTLRQKRVHPSNASCELQKTLDKAPTYLSTSLYLSLPRPSCPPPPPPLNHLALL